jgi:UDP-N-acetylglucosamine diphosphorylase/glucosamine-1-phosphate N-acetyltransferase
MHLVIFEASKWDTFAPLTINRPVFTLLCGMTSLLDKQLRHMRPERVTLWVRPQLAEFCRKYVIPKMPESLRGSTSVNTPLDDEPAVISSGRTLHFSRFEVPNEYSIATDDGNLVRTAFVKAPGLSVDDAIRRTPAWLKLLELPQALQQARLPEYLWDLINWNEEALVSDSIALDGFDQPHPAGPYHKINDENILLAKDVKLAPGVVLDGSRGPVALARGVTIGANSVIEGPCYVGEFSRIAPLTSIRRGSTIGPGCIIGGAVYNTIIMGFTNKPYEGYLGESYVGRWVHLGAGTTTADVKTTYGEVSVTIGPRNIPTGRRSMGALIGDHTKTSINTRFPPGCYVGYFCFLAGAGLVPNFVPSLSFWTDKGLSQVELSKGVEVARRVMDRRDRTWSSTDDAIHEYAVTEGAGVVEK